MEAKRLIVGYGYLGRQIAAIWRSQGSQVYATTRSNRRFEELQAAGVMPLQWDVCKGGSAAFPAAETMLYCVGYDRGAGVPMREVYVEGLRRTLSFAPAPRRLIYVSSTGVYGDASGDWVDEETEPAPMDESGQICLDAERTLREACQERGIEFVILRLAGIYGPGRMIGADALRKGEPIRSEPDVYLNLIEVSDAAGAVAAVAQKPSLPSDLYLVSDGRPPLRRDFYGEAARLLNVAPPVFESGGVRKGRGNRRISNRRLLDEIAPAFRYPDYADGLLHCL